MANLFTATAGGAIYNPTTTTTTEVGTNYATSTGNGIAGNTIIVAVTGTDDTNVTQTELDGVIRGVNYGETAGSPSQTDAFTVIGVAGTVASGTMYLALQGTGTVQTTKGDYFTATKLTVTATFEGLQA